MKILVIRFSSIGDIVLTTPVIRCLKQQLPGVVVHFLTKEQFLPVVEANPFIDRVFTIGKVNTLGSVISELKKEHYSFIVDLHKNLRTFRVLLGLMRPFGTFSKLNFRKWLICRFKINLLPDIHIVDRYFHAVKRLGVSNDGGGLQYFVPQGVDPFPKLPGLQGERYTALVIGGKHATKQLPADKLLVLCQSVKGRLVILGGKEDSETGEMLELALKNRPPDERVYQACGKLSLHESAAVLREAARVITHDTGLMHIAAAFEKDIISIWGNTIPGFGMYPYFPSQTTASSEIWEVKGLKCRPCSKLGHKKCPEGHFLCMNEMVLPNQLKKIIVGR